MPRLSLTYTLPVIFVIGGFLLFVHKWTEHAPESAGAAAVAAAGLPSGAQSGAGLLSGSEANPPPATSTGPAPAAAPAPEGASQEPAGSTQTQ